MITRFQDVPYETLPMMWTSSEAVNTFVGADSRVVGDRCHQLGGWHSETLRFTATGMTWITAQYFRKRNEPQGVNPIKVTSDLNVPIKTSYDILTDNNYRKSFTFSYEGSRCNVYLLKTPNYYEMGHIFWLKN